MISPSASDPVAGTPFSLPVLAQAALYHEHAPHETATFQVAIAGPSASGRAWVAAGLAAATHRALASMGGASKDAAAWLAGRTASMGVAQDSVLQVLLTPFHGRVSCVAPGERLAADAPVMAFEGPLPLLVARGPLVLPVLSTAIGAATAARELVAAAGGRSVVDGATVGIVDPTQAALIAESGWLGGFAGTTHAGAAWSRSLPLLPTAGSPDTGVPVLDAPTDATLSGSDLHRAVENLAARRDTLRRVRLARPLTDEVELERHHILRRALDRHGLQRVSVCAVVPPRTSWFDRIAEDNAPVDVLVVEQPWWRDAPLRWSRVDAAAEGLAVCAADGRVHPPADLRSARDRLRADFAGSGVGERLQEL